MVAFCLGVIVGAAVGTLVVIAVVWRKLTPHVSDREAGELATWYLKSPAVQRACENYAARSPGRDCHLPAMKAALDAYENVVTGLSFCPSCGEVMQDGFCSNCEDIQPKGVVG